MEAREIKHIARTGDKVVGNKLVRAGKEIQDLETGKEIKEEKPKSKPKPKVKPEK